MLYFDPYGFCRVLNDDPYVFVSQYRKNYFYFFIWWYQEVFVETWKIENVNWNVETVGEVW